MRDTWKVGLNRLQDIFGDSQVRLATEDEFKGLFPGCAIGAMPLFDNLYSLEVYVDFSLTEDEEIVFQGGNHHEAIKVRYQGFATLVSPTVEEFHQVHSKVGSS